jgi:hypothetical protein
VKRSRRGAESRLRVLGGTKILKLPNFGQHLLRNCPWGDSSNAPSVENWLVYGGQELDEKYPGWPEGYVAGASETLDSLWTENTSRFAPLSFSEVQAFISTSAATMTDNPNGSVATPGAMRACDPASFPYRSRISSEKPLRTSVFSVKVGAALIRPVTVSQAVTRSRLAQLLLEADQHCQ